MSLAPKVTLKSSKMLDWTIKRNSYEKERLKRDWEQLENEETLHKILQKYEKIQLKNELMKIPLVKQSAPISAERKKFLKEHGVRLNEYQKEYDISYFMSLIDDVIGSDDVPDQQDLQLSNDVYHSQFPLRIDFDGRNPMNVPSWQSSSATTAPQFGAEQRRSDSYSSIFNHIQEQLERKLNDGGPGSLSEMTRKCSINDNVETQNNKVMNVGGITPQTSGATAGGSNIGMDKKTRKKTVASSLKSVASGSRSLAADRPRWVFRSIDPPRRGRPLVRKRKEKAEDEEEQKRKEEEEQKKDGGEGEASELVGGDEVNDYRYQVLSKNNMSTLFVPLATSETMATTTMATTTLATATMETSATAELTSTATAVSITSNDRTDETLD